MTNCWFLRFRYPVRYRVFRQVGSSRYLLVLVLNDGSEH